MLLPMPGSPASSVTEPGTRPPSSTRSSSPTPVGTGAAARARPRRSAPACRPPRAPAARRCAASASVPHASQAGTAPQPTRRLAAALGEHRCDRSRLHPGTVRRGVRRLPALDPGTACLAVTGVDSTRRTGDGARRRPAAESSTTIASTTSTTATASSTTRCGVEHRGRRRRSGRLARSRPTRSSCCPGSFTTRSPSGRTSRGARRAATGRWR